MRQHQSVHRTWHVDIGENRFDVAAALQNLDRLIGIAGFQGRVPCVLHHVDSTHPNERLVLDDQNDCLPHILVRVWSAPWVAQTQIRKAPT
jgi:hypothetical protein